MIPSKGDQYKDHTDDSLWQCSDVFTSEGYTYVTWRKVEGNDFFEEVYDSNGNLVEEA